MSEEERLKLEEELLLTKSKAKMINMYLDTLAIIKEARELLKATEIENSWFKQFKKKQLEILDKVEENK